MEKIVAGGHARPVKFGTAWARKLCKKRGLTLQQFYNQMAAFEKGVDLDFMLDMFHMGFVDGARVAKKEFDYTVDDLADWMDEDPNLEGALTTLLSDSLTAEKKDTKKKKTNPKPSTSQ